MGQYPAALPNNAAFAIRPHHRRTGLATKRLGKWVEVRERSQHAILRHGMRITLHHHLLRLRSCLIPAELPPGNEELLVRRKAIDRWRRRFALQRLLVREIGNLHATKIPDALAQHELPVDMNIPAINRVAIELSYHAGGLLVKALQVLRV